MADARKKILCVEDDRETAALIIEELAEQGFEASAAYDGHEGFVATSKQVWTWCCATSTCPSCPGLKCWSA
jgi:DNA-binding response OmpR family regulator